MDDRKKQPHEYVPIEDPSEAPCYVRRPRTEHTTPRHRFIPVIVVVCLLLAVMSYIFVTHHRLCSMQTELLELRTEIDGLRTMLEFNDVVDEEEEEDDLFNWDEETDDDDDEGFDSWHSGTKFMTGFGEGIMTGDKEDVMTNSETEDVVANSETEDAMTAETDDMTLTGDAREEDNDVTLTLTETEVADMVRRRQKREVTTPEPQPEETHNPRKRQRHRVKKNKNKRKTRNGKPKRNTEIEAVHLIPEDFDDLRSEGTPVNTGCGHIEPRGIKVFCKVANYFRLDEVTSSPGLVDVVHGMVLVKKTGLYYIYSQMTHHDALGSWSYAVNLTRGGQESIVMQCPGMEPHFAKNDATQDIYPVQFQCHTSRTIQLQKGDQLSIYNMYFHLGNRVVKVEKHLSFWGLIKLRETRGG